jgi:hypothetical protein
MGPSESISHANEAVNRLRSEMCRGAPLNVKVMFDKGRTCPPTISIVSLHGQPTSSNISEMSGSTRSLSGLIASLAYGEAILPKCCGNFASLAR